MRPVFRPIKSTNILIVDDNFSEIVGVASVNGGVRNSYNFKANFKLVVNKNSVDPRNYRKVVVTVKKKTTAFVPGLNSNVFDVSIPGSDTSQNVPQVINSQTLNQNLGLSLPTLTNTLESRVYSGLQITSDASRSDSIISTREINLNFSDTEINSLYKFFDVVQDTNSLPTPIPLEDYVEIEKNNLLQKINRELVDITNPVTEPYYSSLSSPVNVSDIESYSTRTLQLPPKSLYAAMVRFYLDVSPRLQNDRSLPRYIVKENLRKAESVSFDSTFRVDSNLSGEILEVKFDLYSKTSNVPVESITKELSVSRHIEAYESVQKPPYITATSSANSVTVTITDREIPGKVTKFKVYVKDINYLGETSDYRLVGETLNIGTPSVVFDSITPLMAVRVIPVNTVGAESNVYTNAVVGTGYSSIGKMSFLISRIPDITRFSIYNIPKGADKLELYRRTYDSSPFELVQIKHITNNNNYEEFVLRDSETTVTGGDHDYYIKCIGPGNSQFDTNIISNVSKPVNNSSDISVTVTDFKKTKKIDDFEVSFKIKTAVSREENQTIINALSGSALNELYQQLINANNNANTAVDSNDRVTPFYADLYLHEVVRTDLNTGERSTFEILIGDEFVDNKSSRAIRRISDLNPRHSYVYQVFTYRKNPLTLFKNYIKKVNIDNHVYYYSPYKWDNTDINYSRTMPDTDGSDLPIIESYRNLTSTPLGEKNTVRIDGTVDFFSITSVRHERVDRNTIKVVWSFNVSDYASYYDSFVVMKTVNGRRSFIGTTRTNYIYHELNENDIGNIYYTVVPITSEFDIDDSAHSSPFLLGSQGLKDPLLVRSN
jgi:hypothetical protein